MKQTKLIREVYQACLEHNDQKLQELKKKEFVKIFKHRENGKSVVGTKWSVIKL